MEKNRADIEALLYRMQKLDEKYEELKRLVSGTGGSYRELIATKKGDVSGRALNRLIEELVHGLEEFRSYKAAQQKGFGVQMEPYRLTAEEGSFYRSYLYLLLGLSLQRSSSPMARRSRPGTWDALIECAGCPAMYRTMAEIDRDLISMTELGACFSYLSRVPGGIFHDVVCAYWDVLGEDFTGNIIRTEREAACRLMTGEEQYWVTHSEERERQVREEREAERLALHNQEPGNGGCQEDWAEEARYGMEAKERGGVASGGWNWFFGADRERFAESCRTVRRQYCDMQAHGDLREEITVAVQIFLYRRGLSGWGDDGDFFAVYTYADKALKASKKWMDR